MKIYKVAKHWKILAYTLLIFLILRLVLIVVLASIGNEVLDEEIPNASIFLSGFSMFFNGMFILCVSIFFITVNQQIILTDESIKFKAPFSNKEFQFNKIKGFKAIRNSRNGKIQKISIVLNDQIKEKAIFPGLIENTDDLIFSLAQRVKNLDE